MLVTWFVFLKGLAYLRTFGRDVYTINLQCSLFVDIYWTNALSVVVDCSQLSSGSPRVCGQ